MNEAGTGAATAGGGLVTYDMTPRDWLFVALALLIIYGGDLWYAWRRWRQRRR